MAAAAQPLRDRRGRVYTPAIGPRLKGLLLVILAGVALLGANSVYLASITALLSSSMIHVVAKVMITQNAGRMTNGMLAFASTVVRSETGSDFQKRMLRSRRSL